MEDETKQAFHEIDENYWLRTGDIGKITVSVHCIIRVYLASPSQNNFLHIIGREKGKMNPFIVVAVTW